MKNLFTLKKARKIYFKTIPLKKAINIILFKPKTADDLFDNNLNQINDTKNHKNKENINYNELSTSHTFNVENKILSVEINKNFNLKEKEIFEKKNKKI